ncbi:MAG: amidophosphoribosyltransferase [Methanobrevibacter sp.]|nr:amidophosphoribosyltransferase [Candidatus Methanovirga aequatorialis]
MKDKCGIVGINSNLDKDVSSFVYYGLYALQHRGQESAGIATFDGGKMHSHIGVGLLTDAFKDFDFNFLPGNRAIGHVRYSTTGDSKLENSQPFLTTLNGKNMAIAHNGDIVNSPSLRCELIKEGYEFTSDTDSEVLLYLIKKEHEKTNDFILTIERVVEKIVGSYSIVILIDDKLYALRDPAGIKPLAIAKNNQDYIIATETVAFDVIGAKHVRDVEPGEIVYFENNKLKSYKVKVANSIKNAHCVFEYVYFARPDSVMNGKNVYKTRLNIGKHLYDEYKIDADIVVPVPDSSIPATIGYSRASKIPYAEGLIKNRYVGRTFIMPTQEERSIAVKLKINPIKSEVKGKKIVLIDDSIVRGTTSQSLVKILKEAGAKEIHMLIGCPPIVAPCYYGISMASKKELIAANNTVNQMKEMLGVETLGYLSIESLVESIGIPFDKLCLGCINEDYPTNVPPII